MMVKKKRKRNPGKEAVKAIKRMGPNVEFKVYDLSKQGMSNEGIVEALNLPAKSLNNWKERDDKLGAALREGRKYLSGTPKDFNFRDYVFDQLPPELKDTWEEISACEEGGSSIRRIEALMGKKSVRAKQYLFLYAYVHYNFSVNQALSTLGISSSVFKRWTETDDDFSEIMDTLIWHRKNFFEDSLMQLVKSGHPNAIIFVNKSMNADRGYGLSTKLDVNIRGAIQHSHSIVDLDKLDIDTDMKRQLLKQIRVQRQQEELETIDIPSRIE